MIEYVVEHNPDDRTLQRASRILKDGLVCFPTETNWVVVADPYNKDGVSKLYRLRHVENTKHFTVLCDKIQKAQEVSFIDDGAFRILKKLVPGPYTFIFDAQKKITKYLKASKSDKEVGIRFPPRAFCRALLAVHDDVVIASHLTHDMLGLEKDGVPLYSALIEDHFGAQIDLIIDTGETDFLDDHTTIIDFTSGGPELVRQGAGTVDFL